MSHAQICCCLLNGADIVQEVNPNAGPNHGTASLWGLRETPDLQDWDSAGHLQSAADQGYPVASTCCHSLVEEFEHRCPQRLQILRSVMQLLLSSDRTQPFPGAALPAVTLQGSEDEEAFQEFLTIMRGMLSIDDNETSLKARNTVSGNLPGRPPVIPSWSLLHCICIPGSRMHGLHASSAITSAIRMQKHPFC